MAQQATTMERNRRVFMSRVPIDDTSSGCVGECIEDCVACANEALAFMEILDIGRYYIAYVPSVDGEPDPEIMERLKVIGGCECECCGKKWTEMEDRLLFYCTHCKKAYYCSAECQCKWWKAGHKHACRAPGQIEAGDYMRLKGLVTRWI